MEALIAWVQSDWPLLAACVSCFLAGARFEQIYRRRSWERFKGRAPRSASLTGKAAPPCAFDAAEQLRVVERATFTRRRLLNRGEARLLKVLEEACAAVAPEWRVMAQVSLGEVLASPDPAAYRAINSKRVDLLLVDSDGHARHAVEFQGSGHHLGPAATRDAIKKEALRRAGIGYAEVVPGDTPTEVRGMVVKLLGRETMPVR